jgi:hypothetical protein
MRKRVGETMLLGCAITLAGVLGIHIALLLTGAAVGAFLIVWDAWGAKVAGYASVPLVALGVVIAWQAGVFWHSTPHVFTPSPTIKTVFVPSTGEGEVGSIRGSGLGAAICVPSLVDRNRPSAYDCVLRSRKRAFDPCFPEILVAGVECFDSPWQKGGEAKVVVLAPITFRVGKWRPVGAWREPWALELPGGVRCLRTIRAYPAPVETLYLCGKDRLRGERLLLSGWIVGDFPNEAAPIWTVSYVEKGNPTASALFLDVVRAWE